MTPYDKQDAARLAGSLVYLQPKETLGLAKVEKKKAT